MKHSIWKTTRALIPLAVVFLVILAGFYTSHAEILDTSKVIFHVG